MLPRLVIPDSPINTDQETICANVRLNIRRGLQQVKMHPASPEWIVLACGGPSLEDTFDELRQLYWLGRKVIAVNGAYRWLTDRNIRPSAAIVMDARKFNARFVDPAVPNCKYFLASQCAPEIFDACAERDVHLFHVCTYEDEEKAILNEYYFGKYRYIPGGMTVSLRAITLLRTLGFHLMDIFGLDSCVMQGKHHAYPQAENDSDDIKRVWMAADGKLDEGREFWITSWHAAQLDNFMAMIRVNGDLFKLNVHGDGLIAYAMRTGARLVKE